MVSQRLDLAEGICGFLLERDERDTQLKDDDRKFQKRRGTASLERLWEDRISCGSYVSQSVREYSAKAAFMYAIGGIAREGIFCSAVVH